MAKRSQAKPKPALPDELHPMVKEWGWFFALGFGLIILGCIAIGACQWVTEAAVVVLGILLLIGGIIRTVSAFWSPRWSGIPLHLAIGILYLVVGGLIIDDPKLAAAGLTLLMAVFFIFTGILGIVWSLQARFYQWGWALLNGFVALILGIFVLKEWPYDSPVLIGLFIGVEMIFCGLMWVMLARSLRRAHQQQ